MSKMIYQEFCQMRDEVLKSQPSVKRRQKLKILSQLMVVTFENKDEIPKEFVIDSGVKTAKELKRILGEFGLNVNVKIMIQNSIDDSLFKCELL